MAISYVGYTFLIDNSGTSYSLASPTGGTSDVLCLFLDTEPGGGGPLAVTAVSGGGLTYTQQETTSYDTDSNAYLYTAPTTSSSATTVDFTTSRAVNEFAGEFFIAKIFRYTGVDTAGPVGNTNQSGDVGQSTTVSGGSITITAGNTSALFGKQYFGSGPTFTPPTNWTERHDSVVAGDGIDAYFLCDRIGVPSTTTYNPVVTSSVNQYESLGFHIELVPAAGGAAATSRKRLHRGIPRAILHH